MIRVAINGYGRIGQCLLRAIRQSEYRHQFRVVVINDLVDPETVLYLTRHDSSHGAFPGQVQLRERQLVIDGEAVDLLCQPDIQQLDWSPWDPDLVFDCTGRICHVNGAGTHLQRGARRVMVSRPLEKAPVIISGFNDHKLSADQRILSAGSCTSACLLPVLRRLDEAFGIVSVDVTSIHSAMNDQPAVDGSSRAELRLNRSGMHSMIPVETQLARGIERLMPSLLGRINATAIRMPVMNVSALNIALVIQKETTVTEVNQLFRDLPESTARILGFSEEPLVSCDYNHDSRSAIVDGTLTRVSNRNLVKLFTWFDNEWAFVHRMLDIASRWMVLAGEDTGLGSGDSRDSRRKPLFNDLTQPAAERQGIANRGRVAHQQRSLLG